MHTADEQAWDRSDLYYEVEGAHVEEDSADRPRATFALVIRHPDVSSTFSIGPFYVPGTPGSVLQAIAEAIPELLRHLEIGIPDARSAALSSPDFWDSVYREDIVIAHLVRDRGVR
jgi:hypothetical protein